MVMFSTPQMMPGIEALYFQERPHTVIHVLGCSQLLYLEGSGAFVNEMCYLLRPVSVSGPLAIQ